MVETQQVLLPLLTIHSLEVHASGCSSVYGVKGVTSDGRGTIVNLTGHSFQYVGSGKDSTNDPDLAVQQMK